MKIKMKVKDILKSLKRFDKEAEIKPILVETPRGEDYFVIGSQRNNDPLLLFVKGKV